MCAPDAYGIRYEINPWMSLERPPDAPAAARQWDALHRVLAEECGLAIELVSQVPDAPDMVFTANAALVYPGLALMARFRHPQRQVEEAPFRAWFEARGYETRVPPAGTFFEGEGDALMAGDVVVAGYRFRTDIGAHRWLAEELGRTVLSVELVDPRWYHLDTAFAPLGGSLAMWYPGAFDSYGRTVLRANFDLIDVPEDEALRFACNAVVAGCHVVLPAGCPATERALAAHGYETHAVPMTEFIKCGGAAKCLTLWLR